METISLVKQPSLECLICKQIISNNNSDCETCGYPLHGTDHEKETFMVLRGNREIDLEEHDKQIRNLGRYLKVIGGFTAFWGFITYFLMAADDKDLIIPASSIVLGAVYFSLGIWSKKKPMAAVVTGLIVFVLANTVRFIFDPAAIGSGIIWKIFIIIAFIQGIRSAKEAEKIKKELYYV